MNDRGDQQAAGVGEDRRIQRGRDRGRDFETERGGKIIDQLARRTRADVGYHDWAGRLFAGQMMVDHHRRRPERAHRARERAETLDVADVEHDQAVDILQRRRALRGAIPHVVAEQRREHLRPRRGIDDVRRDSHLPEQAGERGFGAAAVAIGVDMRRERDGLTAYEQRRQPLDIGAALRRNGDGIFGQWSRHPFPERKESGARKSPGAA